jgi:hypothetical protein
MSLNWDYWFVYSFDTNEIITKFDKTNGCVLWCIADHERRNLGVN